MRCLFPRYWMCHIAIAFIIAAAVWPVFGLNAGLIAGVAFYAGREFTQHEQGGGPGLPMDWPGILAPAVACSLVFIVSKLFLF